MPFDFFENGISNGIIQTPNDYFRDQQQAAISQLWDCTSSRYIIQQQTDFGSNIYSDIEVWIDYVVGMTSRGTTNGDDFRQLLFEDINYPAKRGLYYKFDDNTWITYFTDEYSSLDKSVGVRRCNNVMRIKNPENGSIFSIPCVIDYDMTSPSQQVSRSIITPNNHATIMVQGNEQTLKLFKLNTRYIFGGRPFKLLAYQNAIIDEAVSSNPTLLYLDLYLDEIHAEDDIENQLADNGEYNYSIAIDSTDMELIQNSQGTLEATVSLNGLEVKRKIEWQSDNDLVVQIDENGKYQVAGEIGESCSIKAFLEGNENVFATLKISIVDTEQVTPKVIIEPFFTKVRQFETIECEVFASYGGVSYSPTFTQISLDEHELKSFNDFLNIQKIGNKYQILGAKISSTPQTLYVTVSNSFPNFEKTYQISIDVVSMMN